MSAGIIRDCNVEHGFLHVRNRRALQGRGTEKTVVCLWDSCWIQHSLLEWKKEVRAVSWVGVKFWNTECPNKPKEKYNDTGLEGQIAHQPQAMALVFTATFC